MTHIIWDWNGTLLDDTQAALNTLNAMLARRGVRPMALEFYRANFAFPVRSFYAQIGFELEKEDWDLLAKEYHDSYAAEPKSLNQEAIAALEAVKASGARQSLVSALRQDLLDEAMEEFGIGGYMEHIRGTDNLDGASKLERARELLGELTAGGARRSDVVMIGDAVHDKEVADALGVRCVLCAQGSHAADRLRGLAPTGDTLMEAVGLTLSGHF